MNKHLKMLRDWMKNVEKRAKEEDNSHHSAILWNYLHHVALEQGGEWEEIFSRDLIVENPHYEMRNGPEDTLILDSAEEVKTLYEDVDDLNFFLIDDEVHQTFVNDWGLAEFLSVVFYQTGNEIIEAGLDDSYYYGGIEIDDPDATYRAKAKFADFWPYDEDARLIGELVYQLEPYETTKVNRDDIPTLEDVHAICEDYFPENSDGPTPPVLKETV